MAGRDMPQSNETHFGGRSGNVAGRDIPRSNETHFGGRSGNSVPLDVFRHQYQEQAAPQEPARGRRSQRQEDFARVHLQSPDGTKYLQQPGQSAGAFAKEVNRIREARGPIAANRKLTKNDINDARSKGRNPKSFRNLQAGADTHHRSDAYGSARVHLQSPGRTEYHQQPSQSDTDFAKQVNDTRIAQGTLGTGQTLSQADINAARKQGINPKKFTNLADNASRVLSTLYAQERVGLRSPGRTEYWQVPGQSDAAFAKEVNDTRRTQGALRPEQELRQPDISGARTKKIDTKGFTNMVNESDEGYLESWGEEPASGIGPASHFYTQE